ncbi:MAG: glutamate racemase [Hyphomonadaceae bacterium]|nr:glutamate racemase [Hyphomonadaceae bacterium]
MTETDMPEGDEMDGGAARILVFDSGIGGLTVRQELLAQAPGLTVDYAADTGFFPYGDKADAALRARLPMVAEALVKAACPDIFVIACNTASTLALAEVRAVLGIPVVGTVPAIKPAAAMSKARTIGLLATPGTLARAYTADLIAQFAQGVRVVQQGSLDLVRLAEAVAAGEDVPLEAFRAAQAPMFAADGGEAVDTVVLACTHFPLVRAQLEATAPRRVTYVDSGPAIARQTLKVLAERDIPAERPTRPAMGWVTCEAGVARLGPTLSRYGLAETASVAIPVETAGTAQSSGT